MFRRGQLLAELREIRPEPRGVFGVEPELEPCRLAPGGVVLELDAATPRAGRANLVRAWVFVQPAPAPIFPATHRTIYWPVDR